MAEAEKQRRELSALLASAVFSGGGKKYHYKKRTEADADADIEDENATTTPNTTSNTTKQQQQKITGVKQEHRLKSSAANSSSSGFSFALAPGADPSVRTLALEKLQHIQQKSTQLLDDKQRLLAERRKQLASYESHGSHPLYIRRRKDCMAAIEELEQEIESVRDRDEEKKYLGGLIDFVRTLSRSVQEQKVRPQPYGCRTPKQRFMARFFSELSMPAFTSKDYCTACRNGYVVLKRLALLQCVVCGRCRKYVNAANGAGAWNHAPPTHRHEYVRMKWLFKQLSQFRVGSKKIPKEVIFAVARCLRITHLKSTQLVKHTPVRDIIKQLNYKEYVTSASKIANIINGTKVAQFTDDQFLIVIERMIAIQNVFFMARGVIDRSHFPNVPFLLNHICIMEGWWDLQECFPVQKTDDVYKNQLTQWGLFLPFLRQQDPAHNWNYPENYAGIDVLAVL